MSVELPAPNLAKPRRRVAKGPKRPQYLKNPELDKFMFIITAMLAEQSAVRDRLDTHEVLAERGVVATRANIDAFTPSEADKVARDVRREAMLKRVLRILLEEVEAAQLAISTDDLEDVLSRDTPPA